MIGATREAVARSLAEWRGLGLVTTGRRIVVTDLDGVRRLAAGGEVRRALHTEAGCMPSLEQMTVVISDACSASGCCSVLPLGSAVSTMRT